jgi:molybdate transport system substrate-binding protein
MVFAGAANKPPLTELAKSFEEKSNCKVDVTFAGSGTLLNQIDLEKTGDVYIPGSDDFMEKAKQKKAVDAGSEKLVAWLVPSINVVKGNPKKIKKVEDLAKPGLKVCLADAKAVCLGVVADQILGKVGILEAVKKNVVTYALSCEEVENRVETGEVDAAIGWEVFAKWAPEKIENVPISADLAPRRYISAAVVSYSKQKELAQQFVDFISSEQGNTTYSKHGYTIPQPKEASPPTLGK